MFSVKGYVTSLYSQINNGNSTIKKNIYIHCTKPYPDPTRLSSKPIIILIIYATAIPILKKKKHEHALVRVPEL